MSVVHVEVGDTQWTRAWKCDQCGFTKARELTGKRALSHDTRARRVGDDANLELPTIWLSYAEEQFPGDDHPFADWICVEKCRRETHQHVEKDPPTFHLCPRCATVMLDLLRSLCAEPTVTMEQAIDVRIEESPSAFREVEVQAAGERVTIATPPPGARQ